MNIPFRKIAIGSAGFLSIGVAAILGFGLALWDRTYEAPYPDIRASTDSSIVAHGEYLVFGPAHCAYCHTTLDNMPRVDRGEIVPLTGGFAFNLPIGTIRTANLTPDVETGIGRYTDGEVARLLRHGVKPNGQASMPFMQFQNMSDEDMTAILSYLRAQQPIRNEVPASELNLMGKLVMAFMIRPTGPRGIPPTAAPPAGISLERGEYLATSVADCAGCHTNRDMATGADIGPRFAGGLVMPDDNDPNILYVTPNLTPDPETGVLYGRSEEDFLARFRMGKLIPGSHMPWGPFGRMSDDDLRSIHRYLTSLEPIRNETGPLVQRKS